jgi:hypothetical protein
VFLANQARTNFRFSSAAEFNTYASNLYTESSMSAAEIVLDIELSIYHGNYLEANSSVVCAVFFGIGCGLVSLLIICSQLLCSNVYWFITAALVQRFCWTRALHLRMCVRNYIDCNYVNVWRTISLYVTVVNDRRYC